MTVSSSASSSKPAATVTVRAVAHVLASNVRMDWLPAAGSPSTVTAGSLLVMATVVRPPGSVARATV